MFFKIHKVTRNVLFCRQKLQKCDKILRFMNAPLKVRPSSLSTDSRNDEINIYPYHLDIVGYKTESRRTNFAGVCEDIKFFL